MILCLLTVFASDSALPTTSEGRIAEYKRLEEEMVLLAKRGNWAAVDRMMPRMIATGQPHTPQVLTVFAQAASNRGDILAAKEFVEKALDASDDPELKEWLARLGRDYAPALLAADLPANYRLTPKAMPFVPEHRAAVTYAQQQILTNSFFDGLLPKGSYRFAPYGETEGDGVFDVEIRGGRRSIDLRTHEVPTKADRRKRAKLDRKLLKGQ